MYMGMAIIAISLIVGIGSIFIFGQDNKVEEAAEVLVEDETEKLLNLPDDSLKGKIDFSLESKEK